MISTKKMWDKIMNKNWVMQKFIWGGRKSQKKSEIPKNACFKKMG